MNTQASSLETGTAPGAKKPAMSRLMSSDPTNTPGVRRRPNASSAPSAIPEGGQMTVA
jgi:hypothetical protein